MPNHHQNISMEDIVQARYGLSRTQARQIASETRLAMGMKANVAWSKSLEEQCIALCAQRGLIKDRKEQHQVVPTGFLQACSDSFTMLSITEQESTSQLNDQDDDDYESDDSTIHSDGGGNAPWWRMDDSNGDILGGGDEDAEEDLLELSDDDGSVQIEEEEEEEEDDDDDENDTAEQQPTEDKSSLPRTSHSQSKSSTHHSRTSLHEQAAREVAQESPAEPCMSPLQSFLSKVSGSKRVRFVEDNAKSIRSLDGDTQSVTNTTVSSSDTLTTHSSGWRFGQHPRRPSRRAIFPPPMTHIPLSPLRAGFHDSAQEDARARTSPRVPRRRMSIESPSEFEPPLHVVVEAPPRHCTEQSEE